MNLPNPSSRFLTPLFLLGNFQQYGKTLTSHLSWKLSNPNVKVTYDQFLLPLFYQKSWNVSQLWMVENIGEYVDPNQFGSLKGSYTAFCLSLDLVHNWLSEMDNLSCYIRACFLALSKAVDGIDHDIVIKKLIGFSVRRSIIPCICSFLTECRRNFPFGKRSLLFETVVAIFKTVVAIHNSRCLFNQREQWQKRGSSRT